jgi:hypothetical protein|nr:MAG TPA: hypothetical protein [Caudoviricetes sp.]
MKISKPNKQKKNTIFTPEMFISVIRYLSLVFITVICTQILYDFFRMPHYDAGIILVNIFAVSIMVLIEIAIWIGAPLFIIGGQYEAY